MCCTCTQFVPITITRLDKAKSKRQDMLDILKNTDIDK